MSALWILLFVLVVPCIKWTWFSTPCTKPSHAHWEVLEVTRRRQFACPVYKNQYQFKKLNSKYYHELHRGKPVKFSSTVSILSASCLPEVSAFLSSFVFQISGMMDEAASVHYSYNINTTLTLISLIMMWFKMIRTPIIFWLLILGEIN